MKKLLILTFKILFLTVLIVVVLDFLYTAVYLQSDHRGKIDYVYNSNDRNYDVVILGSSRANNHFVAQMFEDKGLETFNFGMSGSHLFENSLLLKLMVERKYKIKNLILEVDLNLSNEHRADGIASKFLPYIHNSKTIRAHFAGEADFDLLYYIPFYRYLTYDAQIGFREMFFNAIRKETIHLNHLGYYPLGNKKGNMKNDIRALKPLHNKHYEEIKQLCKANSINLIAVMTPMCENTKGIDYFEKVQQMYPEIHNYEKVVQEDKYFSSCGHMNNVGASKFTKKIIDDFFSNE
jgi:hypothetical protein